MLVIRSIVLIILFLIDSISFTAYIDTQVPSSAAGSTGLRTRIHIPDTTRYSAGAPVVIFLLGGNTIDNIDTGSRFSRFGFIVIMFNYPGGTGSGGVYDNRGPNCILALRDIINFATGRIQDNSGKYLHQITNPKVPIYTNVGLFGSSNGGNITIAAAGYFGHEIALAWIVNWESPVGESMPGGECGTRNNPYGNPRLNAAFNDTTGNFDYTRLKYSDTLMLYNQSIPYSGGFYYDINGNNTPNRGTDFIINGYWIITNSIVKSNISTTLIQEAINRGIFPSSVPAHICTISEAVDFWKWRTGDRWIDSARVKLPDLMFMITASDTDHVQSSPGHPHVYAQYEKFRSAGARFVRLNPDRSYVEYTSGQSQPNAPDNNAFEQYTRLTIRNKFMPETVSDINYQAAGICELADRTCSADLTPNLSSVIYCNTIGIINTGSEIPQNFSLNQNYPNPFNPVTHFEFRIAGFGSVKLTIYDNVGREVENIINEELRPGIYEADWDGSDYSSGVYFYKLTAADYVQTRKMVLLK